MRSGALSWRYAGQVFPPRKAASCVQAWRVARGGITKLQTAPYSPMAGGAAGGGQSPGLGAQPHRCALLSAFSLDLGGGGGVVVAPSAFLSDAERCYTLVRLVQSSS